MLTAFETQVLRELQGFRQQMEMLTNYVYFHLEPKLNKVLATVEKWEHELEEAEREMEAEDVGDEGDKEGDDEAKKQAEQKEIKKQQAKIKKEERRLAILRAKEWGRLYRQRLEEAQKARNK